MPSTKPTPLNPLPDTRRADLHLHTTYSDGTLSPGELVRQAAQAGLAAIAVTDHDCVDGVPEAVAASADHLEVIPGIELTVAFRGVELHLLGFFLEIANPSVRARLARMRRTRVERLAQMIERLKTYGVTVSLDEVLALAAHGTAGRPHLARVLAQRGFVKTPEEAFERFLGDKAPCFVKGATLTPATAAQFIREMGGVSTLAHPYKFVPDDWLPELIAAGVQGIEAHHPDHSPQIAEHYRQYAEQHGLLISGGSDAHGSWKVNGTAVGSITVPYECVERLRHACKIL